MSGFRYAPFSQRYQAMGDMAEKRFEAESKLSFVRFGLDRPPVRVQALHQHVRHTPDYLTADGFVEVMGLGREQILRLKVEKLESLKYWALLMPVTFFVLDSSQDRTVTVPLERVVDLARRAPIDKFPEGNAYYAIHADWLFNDDETTRSASLARP